MLSDKAFCNLKERFYLGYYFGFYTEKMEMRYKPDFVVAAQNVLAKDAKIFLNDVPFIGLSGFNFVPSYFSPLAGEETDIVHFDSNSQDLDVLYIGDLMPRKNLLDAIRFFCNNMGSVNLTVVLRSVLLTDKYVISLIGWLLRNTQGIHIHGGRAGKFSRAFVAKQMKRVDALLVPYTKEGASRVVAEGELAGLPIIYNENMKGGSCNFLIADENISMKLFSNVAFHSLIKKDSSEKESIYLYTYSFSTLKKFFFEEFRVLLDESEQDRMINGLSGHRKDLPEEWTNRKTDEISDFKSFSHFIDDVIGHSISKPKIQFGLRFCIKELYKLAIFSRYQIRLVVCVFRLRFIGKKNRDSNE